ncbi:nickel pincer cofactor biosynthesis protein LarB [Mycobacterium sp. URHB0044]|uniref:nickel pincer cofactor biosynthesis protein LarB n=1 Tax=Mycobacterium sp. URHB0044 TaxID=1380386 RepID=UPI001E4E2D6C|nr:nickel pincer cofactor biosynthesis protein LarB [Mycobacterium sp. URHB0044]
MTVTTKRREVVLDTSRERRIGFGEAVLAGTKTVEQLVEVLDQADAQGMALLLTRLELDQFNGLPGRLRGRLDYEPGSRTAYFGAGVAFRGSARVAVVTAGTSDSAVAREAVRTLAFHGLASVEISDVGVAGLWRLQQRIDEIASLPVVIAVAGMDAALPTVLGGLVPALIIAVPTSVGYGIAEGGKTALHALLASCAPGLVTVNIDNGYGAACAAMRALHVEGSRDA